jgi:hypothetical protein
MVRYKVWYQPSYNRTIFDDDTRVYYLDLNDAQRVGFINAFYLAFIDDPYVNQRFQLQPIFITDPSIDFYDYSRGYNIPDNIFPLLTTAIDPVYFSLPEKYHPIPNTKRYYVTVKIEKGLYLIVFNDVGNIEGLVKGLDLIGKTYDMDVKEY